MSFPPPPPGTALVLDTLDVGGLAHVWCWQRNGSVEVPPSPRDPVAQLTYLEYEACQELRSMLMGACYQTGLSCLFSVNSRRSFGKAMDM